MSTEKRFVDIAHVAKDFDVCRQTIDRWVESGIFPAPLRFGRRKVWMRTTIETFVDAKAEEAKGVTPESV